MKDFGVPFANSKDFIKKLDLIFCKKERFLALHYNIFFIPTIYSINMTVALLRCLSFFVDI